MNSKYTARFGIIPIIAALISIAPFLCSAADISALCDGPCRSYAVDTRFEPKILTDFSRYFPEAADEIRYSRHAVNFVMHAENFGAEFGGYAESSPFLDIWAHCIENKAYVPKYDKDKILSMSNFLFELNNAIRRNEFRKIENEAAQRLITPWEYAYKKTMVEVDGMLSLAMLYLDIKRELNITNNDYDHYFYLSDLYRYSNGTTDKHQLTLEVMKRKYSRGKNEGKTPEIYYSQQCMNLQKHQSGNSLAYNINLAFRGDTKAQFWLYKHYIDKDANKELAMHWLKKSADGNNLNAIVELAASYEHGVFNDIRTVLPQNVAKSKSLYEYAAKRQNTFAQFRLGILYMYGGGTPKDYVAALKWLLMAERGGMGEDVRPYKEYLLNNMNDYQIQKVNEAIIPRYSN